MMAVPPKPMRWSIISTSPYLEQLWGLMRLTKDEDGVCEFHFPKVTEDFRSLASVKWGIIRSGSLRIEAGQEA